jgi:uncharacterized RDD family membrane protein YckC
MGIPSLFVQRVLAYGVDCALLFVVLAPLSGGGQWALGVGPTEPQAIYGTLLLTFSLPAWAYFAWGDRSRRGATWGKRWMGLCVRDGRGRRVRGGRAVGRTAVKMLPWELVHLSAFGLAPEVGVFGVVSWTGLGLAYVLIAAYLGAAGWTGGRRSVHDWAAGTQVGRAGRGAGRR